VFVLHDRGENAGRGRGHEWLDEVTVLGFQRLREGVAFLRKLRMAPIADRSDRLRQIAPVRDRDLVRELLLPRPLKFGIAIDVGK